MIGDKTEAEDGSVAIGGNNTGPVLSVNASGGSNVHLQLQQKAIKSLPSYLSKVILFFSEESLSLYAKGNKRTIPPEVIEKLSYNNISTGIRIIREYSIFISALEKTYSAIEQRNPDARYLVRRKAGLIYDRELKSKFDELSVPLPEREKFAIVSSAELIEKVINNLLAEYAQSSPNLVEEENAHLAISLVVADAIVECEVLQRPPHAFTS